MELWTDLYTEIAEKIQTNIPQVRWVDLWHDQISYLTDELPFPSPAVFIAFRTIDIEDASLLTQLVDTQIDIFLFFETFSDTYNGAYNQTTALDFMRTLTDIHKLLHGQAGDTFNTLRRVYMGREESGSAGNLYRISFVGVITDSSAEYQYNQTTVPEDVDIQFQSEPIAERQQQPTEQLYIIE